MSEKNLVEIVNLPIDASGAFRVLQINIGSVNHLVFGIPPNNNPHPNILVQFLNSRRIAYSTIKSRLYRGVDIPSPTGKDNSYLVTGAGYCGLDSIRRRFIGLSSDSTHYRISIDREAAVLTKDSFLNLGYEDLSNNGMQI